MKIRTEKDLIIATAKRLADGEEVVLTELQQQYPNIDAYAVFETLLSFAGITEEMKYSGTHKGRCIIASQTRRKSIVRAVSELYKYHEKDEWRSRMTLILAALAVLIALLHLLVDAFASA